MLGSMVSITDHKIICGWIIIVVDPILLRRVEIVSFCVKRDRNIIVNGE